MREITFRGKLISNYFRTRYKNGWIYGDYLRNDTSYFIIDEFDEGSDNSGYPNIYITFWQKVIPETVGQFTGLYDKNGKEIFEGDIVKVSTDDFREDTIHFIKYGIDQDYPAFDIEPCLDYAESNSLQYLMVWKDIYTIEIIGNIHDNPELLKEQ